MSIRSGSYWSRPLNRRRFLKAGAAGAAGLASVAALGCSDDDDESDDSGSAGQNDDVKRGGNLRLGFPADLANLEPHILTPNTRDTLYPIYDTLTTYDHDLKPHPTLAASWEQTDGGATVVVKLRQGVTYHSGREFTSEDVKWNLARVVSPDVPYAQFRLMGNWFPTVEVPDKYTIILKSDKPRPATFDFFELFRMADSVTKGGPDAEKTAVGTGPFQFVEWRQGQHLKLAKNPTYWNKDVPNVDELTWNLALEAETMLAQFEAGGLDGVDSPSITGFKRFQDNSNFQTMIHPSPGAYYVMGFNVTVAPFTDKRVRQAFNWALDRQRFANLIMRDIVEPYSLPWPKVSLAYEEAKSKHYSLDLKKAADLLRAANASGLKTAITTRPNQAEVVEFVSIWQNDLKSIGVDMEIQPVETAAFGQIINNLRYQSIYAASASWSALGSPASLFFIAPNVWGGDGKNNTGFDNAGWRELVEQATTEIDTNKQRSIYSQLNDLMLDESHIPVYAPTPWRIALAKNVRGVDYDMQDSYDYSKAWLA